MRPSSTPASDRPRSPAAQFAAPDRLSDYWRFYRAVAEAQIARWLPKAPSRILDLSSPDYQGIPRAIAEGHDVVALLPSTDSAVLRPLHPVDGPTAAPRSARSGRLHQIVGDPAFLRFLSAEGFDGVIADNRMLSRQLATEESVAQIARVLRPGGRVLLCVDSVVLGMALLAEQDCWPELSHAPSADVLLVPWPDGSITRCFTADQLTDTLTGAGLELEWIKPRTVLSASTVEMMLARDPRSMNRLVEMELRATESDDYVGVHLVASARKPS